LVKIIISRLFIMPFNRNRYYADMTRGAVRRRSAGLIARAWRRNRKRRKAKPRPVHNQRYNRVSNHLSSYTRKGKSKPHTLKARVAALETSAKKHWDVKSYRKVTIHSWGVATNIQGQFGDAFLQIPSKNTLGEITPSDAPELAEDMVRDGDDIFIKSALIKFRLNTYESAVGLSQADYGTYVAQVANNLPLFHVRVVFTILQDMRPSLQTLLSTSEPNPLPQAVGMRPLESIYEKAGLYNSTSPNSMITCDTTSGDTNYGADNCLQSFDSLRFKKIHQSTIILNHLTPSKQISHRLLINRKAKYMVASQAEGDPLAPSYPLNFNYLLFLSTTASIDTQCNLQVPAQVLALMRPPSIDKLSIRTYFTDS